MKKSYENIDAGQIFIGLTSNEIDAMMFNYNLWTDSMKTCVELDCLEDNLFAYRVVSILHRVDYIKALLNVSTDISYQPGDMFVPVDTYVAIIQDLVYVLECQLDITEDTAHEMDVDDPAEFFVAFEYGTTALAKLKAMFDE